MIFLYKIFGIRKLLLILENLFFNLIYFRKLGNKAIIYGFPIIEIEKNSKITIGKNLTLISNSYFSEPGVNHPVIIKTLRKDSIIRIGNNVGISGSSVIAAKEINIGNDVMLGSNVTIVDTDFHSLHPINRRSSKKDVRIEKVIIEDNVFIGMSAIILKGVTIGKNSIIGAGSIVTNNIPPNCIAGGNPAKVIKPLK